MGNTDESAFFHSLSVGSDLHLLVVLVVLQWKQPTLAIDMILGLYHNIFFLETNHSEKKTKCKCSAILFIKTDCEGNIHIIHIHECDLSIVNIKICMFLCLCIWYIILPKRQVLGANFLWNLPVHKVPVHVPNIQ